jgi:MFS family permease
MHGVGAGWLMTEIAPSPLVVALVQAATTLPMFLLLLPAGALGDILDRRRLLLLALSWSVVAALLLGLVTLTGRVTPLALLLFTFALGIGAALAVPSFQAVVPELVPRDLLPSAVALSSMGVNIARAAGPALAGLVIASLGVAAVFVFNAASTIFTIFVLWRWQREPRRSALPPEPFISALRIGARYARHNPQLGALLVRSAAFYSFAAALWALLPLVGAQLRPQDATGYAVLLSCIGAGAVIAALTLPRIRSLISSHLLSVISILAFAAATAAAGLAGNFYGGGVHAPGRLGVAREPDHLQHHRALQHRRLGDVARPRHQPDGVLRRSHARSHRVGTGRSADLDRDRARGGGRRHGGGARHRAAPAARDAGEG